MTAPRCQSCAKPMRPWTIGGYGYNGDDAFCTLRCGYAYALAMVRHRRRSG